MGRNISLKVPERDILRTILQYLQLRGYVCKRNNSGMTFGESNGKRWAMHIGEAGWPDIIGMLKDGRFLGIEVKARGGKLSEAQSKVLEMIRGSGGKTIVAYSLDDVLKEGI